jgi:hypothetical protein
MSVSQDRSKGGSNTMRPVQPTTAAKGILFLSAS